MAKRGIALTLITLILLFCAGCTESQSVLPDEYYEVDMSFPGMQMEYYTENPTSYMQAVDNMIYKQLPEILTEYLNGKGNDISEIKVNRTNGKAYREEDTVATLGITVTANDGEVKSGEYVLAAYFTYDKTEGNNRIYFVNYAFIPNAEEESFHDDNKAIMFDHAAEAIQ